MTKQLRDRFETLLKETNVSLDGSNPWDIHVKDDRFFARVLSEGSLGLGESYMDGWWECERIDEMINRLLRSDIQSKLKPNPSLIWDGLKAYLLNRQNKIRAFEIGLHHYDIGNDLYRAMLDARMTYTCGYWKNAQNLDQAQEAKLDLVCRKIGLKTGDRVLDIGCGWGSFAKFAAEKYHCLIVGITVSKEQKKLAQELCHGLPIEIRLQDYRDVHESFDHVVSLGMFEHVGSKNYRTYFDVVRRCLKEEGFFLLHTIGGNHTVRTTDPWIEKYIFPNSMLPSAAQITKASEGLFVMEDWHNFGTDYDKTLLSWYQNIESKWKELPDRYDERFRRMWRFYLLSCAGSFRARQNQLWQIVFSKQGILNGFLSLR